MESITHDITQLISDQIKLLKQCYIYSQQKEKKEINFLPELTKLALCWLKYYRSQPDLMSHLLFVKLADQPFYIQKNIKFIILTLALCHKEKVHPALISPLIIAGICKDLIYLKIMLKNKPQLNDKQLRQYKQKNPSLSAKIFAQCSKDSQQQQLISVLIKHQFETLDGKGPNKRFQHNLSYAEQIFSLCCLFIEKLECLSSGASKPVNTVLNSLCTTHYAGVNSRLLDQLYACFTNFPLGCKAQDKNQQTVLISYHHQQRSASLTIDGNGQLLTNKIREIPFYQLTISNSTYICSNTKVFLKTLYNLQVLLEENRNYTFINKAEISADITACPNILKLQKMAQVKQGIEINQLAKEIGQFKDIEQDLCQQAQALSRKNKPIKNIKQALMMLGLNRVPSWVVRNHLEKELLSLTHQQTALCLQIMRISQYAAAELALQCRLLLPEKAKLLLSYLLLPAMYNARLAIKNKIEFNNSAFNAPDLYQVSGEKYAQLSQIIATEWHESSSFIALTRQQLKNIDDVFTSKDEQKLLSLSMLSIHVAYLCFHGNTKTTDKTNIKNTDKCLVLLGLKQKDLDKTILSTIHEINPSCPV